MVHAKWFDAKNTEGMSDVYIIRRSVFIDEQNIPENIEIDGTDKDAIHLVAYENDKPAATGRLVISDNKHIIGRVAVLKEKRGQGLGGLVMRMLIRRAYDMGAEKQYVHAQIQAKGFYESLGFTESGSEYEEAGIPHVDMVHEGDIGGNCGR